VVAAGEFNTFLAGQVLEEAERRYKLRRIYENKYYGTYKGKKMKMFVGILTAYGESVPQTVDAQV